MNSCLYPFFTLAPLLMSCQDDDRCEELTGFNGGVCVNVICNCLPGYTGINYQDFKKCDSIVCMNGGTDDTGNCECPPYYQCVTCDEQITPSTVSLTEILVTLFPVLNEIRQPCDLNSLPEISPQISEGSEVLFTAPSTSVDASLGGNHTWQLTKPFEFREVFKVHSFKLMIWKNLENWEKLISHLTTPIHTSSKYSKALQIL